DANDTADVGAAAASGFWLQVSAALTAGQQTSVLVTATDAYGNLATNYVGTIHFTSSDGQAVLPGNFTFNAAALGAHYFVNMVTLKTAGAQSLTVTDIANPAFTGSAGIVISAAPPTSLQFAGVPANVASGQVVNVTLSARDAYNNVAPSYRGMVQFSS